MADMMFAFIQMSFNDLVMMMMMMIMIMIMSEGKLYRETEILVRINS